MYVGAKINNYLIIKCLCILFPLNAISVMFLSINL